MGVGCLCLFVGCATTRPRHEWTDRALDAETAHQRGELDAAETEYRALLQDPPTSDRERWLRVNLGLLLLEKGLREQALDEFRRVYDTQTRDQHGANALYEVAKLADDANAVTARVAVIRTFPEEVAAEFALQEIVGLFRRDDRLPELEPLLAELANDVADSELGDNLWFELGRLRQEDLNKPNAALRAYRELYRRYYKGPLADDALWEMSNIYRAYQLWEPAITLMTRLADDVEASWFIGDYESDWVDDAIFDVGWVKLVHVGDYSGARQWLERYLKRYPEGWLNDDAVWHIAESYRLQGDEVQYRSTLQRLVRDHPESRYVDQARARLDGGGAS